MRTTILHTNDIHGRVVGLARAATHVARIRAETPHPVLYLDAGDVEETTNRLSNITKGAAMHRLLSAAGCDAATVGNAAWLRYGPQVIADHARVARYPLLLANLKPVEGVHDSVLLGRVGVIGVTASFEDLFGGSISFGVEALPEIPLVRELARDLRSRGAELVVVLSHLGYEVGEAAIDDKRLARELDGEIDVVICAHSHHLLPHGDRIGGVVLASAGEYAQHLGRIDIDGEHIDAGVVPVGEETPPHPDVVAEAARIEPEVEAFLGETLGEVEAPLDGAWIAQMLRDRASADVGLAVAGQILSGPPLPPGPVVRGALWDVCDTSANPGVATISGERLRRMIEIGRSRAWTEERRRPLRGRAHERLHVTGIDVGQIDPGRDYVVGATDYELEPYGGLVERDWNLRARYDFPTIVREAIEEHLRR